jgi:hypothetical protein
LFTDVEARNTSITVFDMCGKTLYRSTSTKLKDSKILLSETQHTVILSVCFEDGSCLNQLVPAQP